MKCAILHFENQLQRNILVTMVSTLGRSDTTLLIRHLPSELSDQEKCELLCHFGASAVRPMGVIGPMKHTAFADFKNPDLASRCLKRLHQMDILGCKLVIEFAKLEYKKYFPVDRDLGSDSHVDSEILDEKKAQVGELKHKKVDDDAFEKHNIPYPKKPSLQYMYPAPTVSTLTNIANALASHPKFYTQVLHLMNKMNLPCPFGVVTPSPPLALESFRGGSYADISGRSEMLADGTVGQRTLAKGTGEIEEVEMEYPSTEESEIESEDEKRQSNQDPVAATTRKATRRPRKKMKLVHPDWSVPINPKEAPKPNEVFETVDALKLSHIVINITGQGTVDAHEKLIREAHSKTVNTTKQEPVVVEGGFGKVEPKVKEITKEEVKQKADAEYKIDPYYFLSKKDIQNGRLTHEQLKEFTVFKNYVPGEVTSRIYIKNLTKQTNEQQLVDVFGSFIDWSQSLVYDIFDIRLMKEGRMKGQAFVTLPDEGSADKIVRECNGYVLNNKPMVIQFARSAKAKEIDQLV